MIEKALPLLFAVRSASGRQGTAERFTRRQGMEKRKAAKIIMICWMTALAVFVKVYYRDEGQPCTKQLFAMDTYMSFTAYGRNGEKAVDAAMEEVRRLDALLSTGDASSEVSRINAAGDGTMSKDTKALLQASLTLFRETGGLFDPTVYPLMELWGFPTGEYHVPTEAELEEVLALVDASRIEQNGTNVLLGEGQKIDFGGIAKGYASNQVMEIFREYKITSGMVSLGGNVQVIGRRTDGSRWQVGIQNPEGGQGEVLGVVEAEDQAVITSGGYERYFEEDGNTYIHIIDPRTGFPADSGLSSVTVLSADGMLADALSTSLYIMGYDRAVSFWQDCSFRFDLILVTAEGDICITEGLEGAFHCEHPYRVLRRE